MRHAHEMGVACDDGNEMDVYGSFQTMRLTWFWRAIRAHSTRYACWGNKLTGTIPQSVQYGYTGREPDETGLIYYRARYYDPSIGRFTQRDPIGLRGGINRYAYVTNNPVNFTDPLGLIASSSVSGGGGFSGGLSGGNKGPSGGTASAYPSWFGELNRMDQTAGRQNLMLAAVTPETVTDVISLGLSVNEFRKEPSFLNGVGVLLDGLGTALPLVPAGIGIIRSIGNGTDAVGDVARGLPTPTVSDPKLGNLAACRT